MTELFSDYHKNHTCIPGKCQCRCGCDTQMGCTVGGITEDLCSVCSVRHMRGDDEHGPKTELHERVEKLEAALRPFVEAFEPIKLTYSDPYAEEILLCIAKAGDFRRAWELLGGTLEKGLPE